MTRAWILAAPAALAVLSCTQSQPTAIRPEDARALQTTMAGQTLTAPPRKIDDIAARLEAALRTAKQAEAAEDTEGEGAADEAETPERAADKAAADRQPASTLGGIALANFYRQRANAARRAGRPAQDLDDNRRALEVAKTANHPGLGGFYANVARAERDLGSVDAAFAALEEGIAIARRANQGVAMGMLNNKARWNAFAGRLEAANQALVESDAYMRQLLARPENQKWREDYRGLIEEARSSVLSSMGKSREAETAIRQSIDDSLTMQDKARRGQVNESVASIKLTEARRRGRLVAVLRDQHRLVEAEGEARLGLQLVLESAGPLRDDTVFRLIELGWAVFDQGRFPDAQTLFTLADRLNERMGTGDTSRMRNQQRSAIAATLVQQDRFAEALPLYRSIDVATASNPQARSEYLSQNSNFAMALIETGRAAEAEPIIDERLRRAEQQWGPRSRSVAFARGLKGAVLARLDRPDEAWAQFSAAIQRLVVDDVGAGDGPPTANDHLRRRVLGYAIDFLIAQRATPLATRIGDPEGRAFALADVVRGLSVQAAIRAADLRVAAEQSALGGVVRDAQDVGLRIRALQSLIATIVGQPAARRDETALAAVRRELAELEAQRDVANQRIRREFPRYAELTAPPSIDVAGARAALSPGEVLVAIHSGSERSYVWAIGGSGKTTFATADLGLAETAAIVARLRRALDPNARTLGEIPPYDVALAHDLYRRLLGPVAASLDGASAMVIATGGPLAQLPFGLLVTAPAASPPSQAQLFAEYRSTPFLIRKVAISQVPSIAALVGLRTQVAASGDRRAFIGFGDPIFAPGQVAELPTEIDTKAIETRGLRLVRRSAAVTTSLASATMADLPRLPDTADELRAIATILKADPARDLFLGPRASEDAVRAADLANRRVVMFATHGLNPGDLDGLAEPALALSNPGPATGSVDGLLTMGEILGLKLNADWVVLSACNTASGNGAGAEALSGLGRAFFYAGTRALLASNWPVETTSARALTTDLFGRQAADPALTRAKALQQAEIGLIDGPGRVDAAGTPLFSYAHPIFWAPFTLVGDGAGARTR